MPSQQHDESLLLQVRDLDRDRSQTPSGKALIPPTNDASQDAVLAPIGRLYGILVAITAVMFAINVAQLAALGQVYDTLWVTLFPALVFAAFILAFILQWWWQQRRSERSVLNFRRAWQQSLIRVANGLTLVLCVAICEFIYLNNYAIPDFEDKQWATSFNASSTLPMPAFALTRAVGVRRTADLVDKSPTFSSACQDFERNSTGPGLDRCFSPVKTLNAAGLGEVEYIIYDGADQTQLGVSSSVDLHFQYQFNSTNTTTPWLGYTVFDHNLIPNFEQAYNCGYFNIQHFPARSRAEINLEWIQINDSVGAAPSQPGCENLPQHYASFRTAVTLLGGQGLSVNENCDVANSTGGGVTPCSSDINVGYSSMIKTTYRSSRRYRFKQALTDEGGIVGFIQFVALFLMLWKE